MWQHVQVAMSEHGAAKSRRPRTNKPPGSGGSVHCVPHPWVSQVPSHAHLFSLAFEALGWHQQPTLTIDGERSRKVWRVLGTDDIYLTGQRCWKPQPQPPVPHSIPAKIPQQPSKYLSTPNPPIPRYRVGPQPPPLAPILNLLSF